MISASLSTAWAASAVCALKNFVDGQMQPGDLIAIVRTGAGMGALQQFTADKRVLYAAIPTASASTPWAALA